MFWAARAASFVVSVRVCSSAEVVESREITVLIATLMTETPSVARMTRIMIFVCIFFIFLCRGGGPQRLPPFW